MDILDLDTSDLDSFSVPPIKAVDFNITDLAVFQVGDTEVTALSDPVYEQFLADVWVGIVLTLMVLSCVCFMCSCLIYHKFQEWKQRVAAARNAANIEAGHSEADLPSYTVASGLPTYEEALEQLKHVKTPTSIPVPVHSPKADTGTNERHPSDGTSLSVFSLFGMYGRSGEGTKPS